MIIVNDSSYHKALHLGCCSSPRSASAILFNIYINGLFYFLTFDICNIVDDTTPYVCNSSLEYVLEELVECSALAIEWFKINEMKMNAENCHLFISGKIFKQMRVRIRGDMMWGNRTVKLLGITIDNELKFDEHLTQYLH